MSEITELLVNLKEFALQYLILTVEDKILFKDYLKNVYYLNGVVGLDAEHDYVYGTNYSAGELAVDVNKSIFYLNGELSADTNENVTIVGCELTIP